jgi:hypothetical protein
MTKIEECFISSLFVDYNLTCELTMRIVSCTWNFDSFLVLLSFNFNVIMH